MILIPPSRQDQERTDAQMAGFLASMLTPVKKKSKKK